MKMRIRHITCFKCPDVNVDNSVNRDKAHRIAKGYTQTHSVNYEETFAPVEKMTTIQTVIAVGATKG